MADSEGKLPDAGAPRHSRPANAVPDKDNDGALGHSQMLVHDRLEPSGLVGD
jgi:hypothetical protein